MARRLLVFMAVMMGLSVVAVALSPPPPTVPRRVAPVTGGTSAPAADDVEETLDARASEARTITVAEGDALRLTVASPTLDTVEIEGLDLLAAVDPQTPAIFELTPDRAGTYPVRLLEADTLIGTLEVTPSVG